MADDGYGQFCPVSMAAEVLCSRWTLLVLRELLLGSARFNELRRGLPGMSPALLSKRLKDLESAGVIVRVPSETEPGVFEYRPTDSGRELRPIIEAIGVWGHRWVTTEATLKNLDPDLLMWDVRRNINPDPLPARRVVIEFMFNDRPAGERSYWLIVQPDQPVDLCTVSPAYDVDLYVATDLKTMTEIWLGYEAIEAALKAGRLMLTGDASLAADLRSWLRLSVFAGFEKRVA